MTHRARLIAALGATLLAAASLVLGATPAQAGERTITLGASEPASITVTIAKGDTVKFLNSDSGITHTVKSSSRNWSFSKAVPGGGSARTAAFTAAGTFTFTDTYTVVAVPRQATGQIVVPSTPAPSPSASPRSSPVATKSPAPKPSASTGPSPAASATPLPVQSGTAVLPGIGPGVLPTPVATVTSGPMPQVAPGGASPSVSPAADVAAVRYGGKDGLVQPSSHRYGLPAALAVVAIVGVGSLLVRLLLAQPEAAVTDGSRGSRRTGEA